MGPAENPTRHLRKQAARGSKRCVRRPRTRRCLLKGREHRSRPRQAQQRYCSEGCRKAVRRWSRWKAQQRYRDTAVGKEKRNGQSRRYRERVKNRRSVEKGVVEEAARVITPEDFFRAFLRPPRLSNHLVVFDEVGSIEKESVILWIVASQLRLIAGKRPDGFHRLPPAKRCHLACPIAQRPHQDLEPEVAGRNTVIPSTGPYDVRA